MNKIQTKPGSISLQSAEERHNQKAEGAFEHMQRAYMTTPQFNKILIQINTKKNPNGIKWVEEADGDSKSEST